MNWGYRLMFTFIAFALMMGYLAYRAFGTTFELVGKDYYKDELRYQRVIDGTDRANLLKTAVTLTQEDGKIILRMPEEMKHEDISGSVLFYCAYDSRNDRKFTLNTGNNGIQVFDSNHVNPGLYTVKVDWTDEGNYFYAQKNVRLH